MIDIEKLVREGKTWAAIQREMIREYETTQRKINAERVAAAEKAAKEAEVKSKQLESARKQYKGAWINYLDALGIITDSKVYATAEKVIDEATANFEKRVKYISGFTSAFKDIFGDLNNKSESKGKEDKDSDDFIIRNFADLL